MLSRQFQFSFRVNAFACRNNEIKYHTQKIISLSLSLSLFSLDRSDISDSLCASFSRRIADYLRKKLPSPSTLHSDRIYVTKPCNSVNVRFLSNLSLIGSCRKFCTHSACFIHPYYYPAPRGTAVIAVRRDTHVNENHGR